MRISSSSTKIEQKQAEVHVTVEHGWTPKNIGETRIRPLQNGRPGVLGGVIVEFCVPSADTGQSEE